MKAVGTVASLAVACAMASGQAGKVDVRVPLTTNEDGSFVEYRLTVRNQGAPKTSAYRASGGGTRRTTPLTIASGASTAVAYGTTNWREAGTVDGFTSVDRNVLSGNQPFVIGAASAPESGSAPDGMRTEGKAIPPADAPYRAAAYGVRSVIALSAGAEKLDDAQISALREAVFQGLTLVLGKTSKDDPRIADLLPITAKGTRKPGATETVSRTTRTYGLGRVILLKEAVEETDADRLSSLGGMGRVRDGAVDKLRTFPSIGPARGKIDGSLDPFDATLPPVGRVAGILLAYLFLVLPVNFLVLRKIKRPQWAWVTAPAFAALFCGALLRTNAHLANGKPAQASRGVLVSQEGREGGTYFGATLAFLPQAISLNPGMRDYERIDAPGSTTIETPRGSTLARLSSRNLSYMYVNFVRREPGKFASIVRNDEGWTIRNLSPYPLEPGLLGCGGKVTGVVPIPAGGSAKVLRESLSEAYDASDRLAWIPSASENSVTYGAVMKGFAAGPRIGRPIARREGSILFHVAPGAAR